MTSLFARAGFRKQTLLQLCLSGALCGLSVSARAETFAIFDVPGATGTSPLVINNSDLIAGNYTDATNEVHGFIRSTDGTLTSFDPKGSSNTFVEAMNNKGWLAGWYGLGNVGYGFIRRSNGHVTTISAGAGLFTEVTGIDDRGDVCGSFEDAQQIQRAFVQTADGVFTQIDPPNSTYTRATGINSRGVITGWFSDSQHALHGFIRTPDGAITAFDAPEAEDTVPFSINAKGMIAGGYTDPNTGHGFLRDISGEITTFEIGRPGEVYPEIEGASINRRGTVVGSYIHEGSLYRAFQRSPGGKLKLIRPPGGSDHDYAYALNDRDLIVGSFIGSDGISHGYLRTP